MPWYSDALFGLALLVAALGSVFPVLPGVLLAAGTVVVWAIVTGGGAWWFAAGALILLGIGQLVKYLIPGRSLAAAGVPGRSLLFGGVLGIVGFFALPLIGLPVGFVAGIYLAELARGLGPEPAWRSTVHAMRATGLSMLIELASILLAAAVWLVGSAAT